MHGSCLDVDRAVKARFTGLSPGRVALQTMAFGGLAAGAADTITRLISSLAGV